MTTPHADDPAEPIGWSRRAFRAIWHYRMVAATVVVGVAGLALLIAGLVTVTAWLVSVYVLAVAAWQLVDMVRGLLRGRIGIDVLAVSAIVATVAVGEYWAALMVVLMLTGGEALEEYAGRRARRELDALLTRAPHVAHRAAPDGTWADIPVGEVVIGDRLLVRPGEVVPVDGLLQSEVAGFDESQLTGESLPVERLQGETVLSGAVNGASAAVITATAGAADSQYQRIVRLVAEAAASRAPMVRLADRYAVPFTALSYAIGGVAWFLARDPVRFAEVLVVATPCPLLIAAPVAFMAGMSRSSRAGIIVKGGGVLEQLSRARSVAFDKTGTLTHGAPALARVRPAGGLTADALLGLIAAAEQYSTHVVAATLVDAARERGIEVLTGSDVREETGRGVVATIGGRHVVVGKRTFLQAGGVPVPVAPPAAGKMAVYAAVDGVFAGDVEMSDPVRSEAATAVRDLHRLGVERVLLVTGDLAATAEHVAADLGIDDVFAECLPEDKVRVVAAVRERPVVMVGDGVNDAPVLAAADVGIAMGAKGSTAAGETADAVIMVDDVSRVVHAMVIGRQTTQVALQAIWFGIGLSVALMLVASVGLLPAIVGAALQEVVDLAVIGYALRALTERADRRLRGVSDVPREAVGDRESVVL